MINPKEAVWALGSILKLLATMLAVLLFLACDDSPGAPPESPTPPPGLFSTLPTTEPPIVGDQLPTTELTTSTPTPPLTPVATESPTPTPTFTPQPTYTPIPTYTPYPTATPYPTPAPMFTPQPTYTPVPTPTLYPTATPYPTPAPTFTPQPTYTPVTTPRPYPTAILRPRLIPLTHRSLLTHLYPLPGHAPRTRRCRRPVPTLPVAHRKTKFFQYKGRQPKSIPTRLLVERIGITATAESRFRCLTAE